MFLKELHDLTVDSIAGNDIILYEGEEYISTPALARRIGLKMKKEYSVSSYLLSNKSRKGFKYIVVRAKRGLPPKSRYYKLSDSFEIKRTLQSIDSKYMQFACCNAPPVRKGINAAEASNLIDKAFSMEGAAEDPFITACNKIQGIMDEMKEQIANTSVTRIEKKAIFENIRDLRESIKSINAIQLKQHERLARIEGVFNIDNIILPRQKESERQ
jgi:hypothetical protein